MVKRRRKGKRKSTKCPEPFNTLLDLLAGAIMNMIANRMERKYHYRKRGVPNPYRASAIGLSTGRLRKTEDIIRLGGFLGAMGAFDPDDTETNLDTYTPKTSRIPKSNTTWKSEKTSVSSSTESNNKYAWRMNCQDGSAYGIYPEDYETMEAYNKALFDAFVIDDIDENEDTEVPYMFEDTKQKDDEDDACRNFTSKI